MAVRRVDHIAIVIPDIDEARSFYQDALGLKLARVEEVADQEVSVAFFPVGQSQVELVEPVTETSGVARYLEKRGPGIHHLCLEVDDLDGMLARLQAQGVELIDQEPRAGRGGKRLAFIHPRSAYGVLIELYELPRERWRPRMPRRGGPVRALLVETRAWWAGLLAFWQRLRGIPAITGEEEVVIGNGRGITLKAEGEMIQE